MMFAIKHYDNPQCEGEKEFHDDMKRFKYIKRLLRKHKESGILKERLLLNHIIVLNNLFGPEACVTLILFKIQREYWETLKSFLLYLNILREDELSRHNCEPRGSRSFKETVMGRAIDLFVTYRFIKLLTTPFEKTDAYKLGIIDENGNRIMPPPKGGVRQTKPATLEQQQKRTLIPFFINLYSTLKRYLQRCLASEQRLVHMQLHCFYLKTHLKNLSMTQICLKKNL